MGKREKKSIIVGRGRFEEVERGWEWREIVVVIVVFFKSVGSWDRKEDWGVYYV